MKQLKPINTSTIQVFIRIRKQMPYEQAEEDIIQVLDDNTLLIQERTNQFSQKFDYAFGQEIQQVEVFEKIYPSLQEVRHGVNMTVFAYGQTGSGKTYTMFGNDWDKYDHTKKQQSTYYENLETDINNAGIIPRTIYWLFRLLASDFYIYCSFLQIYNEKIYDLLSSDAKLQPLAIHESLSDGIFVEGLSEYAVNDYNDCLMLMKLGEKNRIIRQTNMNSKSSRSHSIFQVIIESNKADQYGNIQVPMLVDRQSARINLCDLAGSEKINKQESINSAHMLEIRKINLSLTTLGKVIQNLSNKQNLPIPYRESKLTRLLQDSLGGDTQTILIANIAPGSQSLFIFVEITWMRLIALQSLLKEPKTQHLVQLRIVIIRNQNEVHQKDHILVSKLQREIDYLKSLLQMKRSNLNSNDIHFKMLKLQDENDRLRQKVLESKGVEILIKENRNMKLEIQKMQGAITLIPEVPPNGSQQKISMQYQQHSSYSKRQVSHQHPRTLDRNRPFMQNGTMTLNTIDQTLSKSRQQSVKRTEPFDKKVSLELQNQKRRVIERLGDLERLQKQNNLRMEEQIGKVTSQSVFQTIKPPRQQQYDELQKKTMNEFMRQ